MEGINSQALDSNDDNFSQLLSAYYVSGTVVDALYILSHFLFKQKEKKNYIFSSPYTDKEIMAQRP